VSSWPRPVVGADPSGTGSESVGPGTVPGTGWAWSDRPAVGFDADAGGTPPSVGGNRRSASFRRTISVVVIAAIVGAAAGAGVSEAVTNGNSSSVTFEQSNAAPGAAVLSGNVSIPSLVHKVLPSVVSIDVRTQNEEDEGTGMIVSSGGEVVTNNHVIALASDGGTITITRSGTTKSIPATLVGTDPTSDVALLQIKGASNLPTITFGDSSKSQVGDAVVAIGNALGLQAGTPTVTQGIVSALGRTVTAGDEGTAATETLTNMIQTDAAINPGNSGGPLIDTAGQVIGMNTAVAGSTGEGTEAENIGFAIPAATIESLLPQLQKGGTKETGGGAMGVDVTTLTSQLREEYGFTPTSGAVVLSVVPGSPAAESRLREGDVIVGVNSTNVTSAQALQQAVSKHKPGDKVRITYYVGDIRQSTTLTLESTTQEQQQQSSQGTLGRVTSTSGSTSGGTSSSGAGSTGRTVNPFGGL
jgi:putative serine protease PepD